jgi:ABC-type glycerol-3-phosphate transport system substrate-binding protein
MKRTVSFLLLLSLLFSLCACGAQQPEQTTAAPTTTAPAEPVELTIGLLGSGKIADYDTNAYTQWLREQTGYDINIQLLPGSFGQTMGAALAAEEDVPDIIWNVSLGPEAIYELGSNGYLLDLTPYFEDAEKSAVFWERMSLLDEDYQDILKRRMTSDDGRIYVFPTAESPGGDSIDYHTYINHTWLEKLGLEMPHDPESLYQVLKAFRDRDPNGNGKKDEVPLAGTTGSLSGDLIGWLINMYIYCDDNRWFNVDDAGKLYLPHTTDRYREALIYIRKLIDEGLLKGWDLSTGTLKGQLCPKDGRPATVGAFVGHATLCIESGSSALRNYASIPIWGCAVRNEPINSRRTYIPASCEHPDAAWEVLMAMCSRESALRLRYGEYGVDWIYPAGEDNGAVGAAILQNVFTVENNSLWGGIVATFMLYSVDCGSRTATEKDIYAHEHNGQLPEETEPAETEPAATEPQTPAPKPKYVRNLNGFFAEAEEKNNPKNRMPLLIYTQAQSLQTKAEREACQTLIAESRRSFITGIGTTYIDPSDDAQWAAYLAELEQLGVQVWMQQAQQMADEMAK